MAVFQYQAIDARARFQRGTVTADTAALARQVLRARGLAITDVQRVGAATANWRRLWHLRLGPRKRPSVMLVSAFWRDLAVLLEAGVPLVSALDVCQRQQRGAIQAVIRQVQDDVRNGQALAEALAAHAEWFDELTLTVVRVGERSGMLAGVLAELADSQQQRSALANKLSTALIYPVILCCVGTIVVTLLMSYVIPQLLEVLTAGGRELPAATRILQSVSDGIVHHARLLLVLIGGLVVALIGGRRIPGVRRTLEVVTLRLPLVGNLLRKVWVARICALLATLLRSDVRLIAAVRCVRDGLPHMLFRAELTALERAVEAGQDLHTALSGSRLFPPLVIQLLAVGQESGELPRMLEQLRSTYDGQVQLALSRLLAVLEPALILVLAIVIGFVVYATLLPILETTRMVQ